jgi:hypothetical protein
MSQCVTEPTFKYGCQWGCGRQKLFVLLLDTHLVVLLVTLLEVKNHLDEAFSQRMLEPKLYKSPINLHVNEPTTLDNLQKFIY